MLDAAHTQTRTRVRSQPTHYTWGIVDVILGVAMFPFALWMWLIERMVLAVSSLQKS